MVVDQTTAAISIVSKYIKYIKSSEVGQAENLHFSDNRQMHTLYLKSLKKLKELPWRGIEPRPDDWQANNGPPSQLFNSIRHCRNFACSFNVT